jgi:hypothetical protein
MVDVAHTRAQLEELTLKIARDAPGWRARGITLGRWGPEAESNTVVIELRSPTTAAAQALYDTYSADWITVSLEPYTREAFFRAARIAQSVSQLLLAVARLPAGGGPTRAAQQFRWR